MYAAPIIDGNGTIYSPSYDGTLNAINPDGSLAWSRFLGGQLRASPAIGSTGNILMLANNGFYQYTPAGALISSNPSIANSDPSVTVASDGTFYLGDAETKKLIAFDSAGGEKWSLTLSAYVQGTPVIGPSGDIYFSTANGFLQAASSLGSLKWSFPIPSQNVKSATVGATERFTLAVKSVTSLP